jgi:pimeloyl-ACP methyl ester carboxylesterase
MTLPSLRHVVANGLRFAYLEEGSGPLVVLLHGFPDTAHTWDDVRPALAEAGYRAVSPFTRGYHPTPVPADGAYDMETLGRDVLSLIGALGEQQAAVVGHDWGASAAYAAANLEPAKLRFLVTVAIPHPAALRPLPRILWGARHMFAFRRKQAEERVRADDFAYVDMLYRRWSPAWALPADETRTVKQAFREPGCLTAALGDYRANRVPAPPALRRRITVPSAVFCGTDDPILKPSDYEYARRFYRAPHEVVRMPGGHFMHREHPEHFKRELLRVLAQG